MTTLAQPNVKENGIILVLMDQGCLEGMLDQWAEDTHREGAYTPDAHGYLFGLVDHAGQLDEVLKYGGLRPDQLSDLQLERQEVCTAAIATMQALQAGYSLCDIVGRC